MAVTDRQDASTELGEGAGVGVSSELERTPWSLSWPVRATLAACSIGAAGIHLAMVPSHATEWLAEGVAFALAGWLQLALAVAVLVRPSKLALQVSIAANLAFIAAWTWSRTAGPPLGPEAGSPHTAGFVDISCVVLEAAIVVIAALALSRPRLGAGIPRTSYVALSIVPVSILVLATAAIASPSAAGHAHAEGTTEHTHDESAGSAGQNDSTSGEAHGHDDGATAASASIPAASSDDAAVGDHGHGTSATDGAPVDDKGLAALANGEMAHEYGPDQPLDAATRTVLVHQLALTRSLAERFPTLADARTAGSRPAGGFGPGMGIHMTTPTSGLPDVPPGDPSLPEIPGTLTDAQILRPANLLYDGTHDGARLAGFMYYSMSPTEPEGFAGPNDHWHTHGSLCIKMGDGIDVLHPHEPSAASCQAIEGTWVERTSWMVHVWTIPGYESSRGVFSDINPAMACPDGTYYIVPEADNEKYQINKCLSNPE